MIDPTGVCLWPFSSYRARWADLERIEYLPYPHNGKWRFRFRLSFTGGKRRQLSLERGNGPKSLRAVATMLRWIGDSGATVSGWKESGVEEILGAAKTLEEIGLVVPECIPCSAKSGDGRREILKLIEQDL